MPVYPCKCECGHEEEVFLPAEKYRDLPEHCGKQMTRVFTPHHVIEDMKPYKSVIDGKWITTRSKHRKHMREHGVIEVGNEKLTRGFRKPYESKDLMKDLSDTYDKLANQ